MAGVRRFLGDVTARVLGAVYVVLVALGYVFAHLAHPAMPWLSTNLTLAAIAPLAAAFLSVARRRGLLWWGAAGTTLVVLPNTPYVLTDSSIFTRTGSSGRRGGSGRGSSRSPTWSSSPSEWWGTRTSSPASSPASAAGTAGRLPRSLRRW